MDRSLGIGRAGRKHAIARLVLLQGHAQLGQAALAGRAAGRFLHPADRGEHHADQNADDGDDDQEFDERKTAAWGRIANCKLQIAN